VVILRDQTEEHPLHQVWSNIPKQSSELMIELRQNWLNDISSGQTIQLQLRWMIQTLMIMNPDIHPPSKAQCPDACCPIAQPEGTISGVSVKLVSGRNGRLEESMVDICWGGLGFFLWKLVMSLLSRTCFLTQLTHK